MKLLVKLDWFSSLFFQKNIYMISGNQSTNSSNFPYQTCLMPNIPADLQHQVRHISNYIIVPFDMLLAVMSFICNALVFVTVTRTKSLRHPSLLMLCSLSISDLIWALFTLVRNSLTLLHPYKCLKESTEKICFAILCYLATLSNLAMISRDRYLAMSRPIWYRNHMRRSSRRVVKATLLPWLSSLLTALIAYSLKKTTSNHSVPIVFSIIFLFYVVCIFMILLNYLGFFMGNDLAMSRPTWYRNHVRRSSRGALKATFLTWLSSLVTALIVYTLYKTTPNYNFAIMFIIIFLFYVVCIVMILLSYLGFFVASRRHSRNLRTGAGNMRAAAGKEKKLTQIISMILLCFFVSFLPALVSPIIIVALRLPLDPFRPFIYLLLTFNGFLNPLLNYGRNIEIRKAMSKMLRGRDRRISQRLPTAR